MTEQQPLDPAQVTALTPDRAGDAGSGSSQSGRALSVHRHRSRSRRLIDWGVILLVVLLGTVLLRTYVVQSFYIPSGSMLPTLQIGDRIIVNKLAYKFGNPQRGDIVVFARPPLENQNYPDLVKRIVGLPGETISSQGGQLYIDGKLLKEPWLPPGPQDYTGALQENDPHPQFDLPGPVKIPPGEYYVMGDNRTNSQDSRFFGPIPKSLIVGKAVAVVWPLSQFKGL